MNNLKLSIQESPKSHKRLALINSLASILNNIIEKYFLVVAIKSLLFMNIPIIVNIKYICIKVEVILLGLIVSLIKYKIKK